MRNKMTTTTTTPCRSCTPTWWILCLCAASWIGAPPLRAVDPSSFWNAWTQDLPPALQKGTFSLNVRARYEFVRQDNLPLDSHAGTIRTRFGFTTAPLYGFQGMLEAENILALDDDSYNAAGANGQPGRPVVADPETTEINQAWISWSWAHQLTLKIGRQRIVFDNQRFIGDVAWRQNMQTYDAATLSWHPATELALDYAYVWDVRRVFGNVSGLPPANRNFDSDSHLVHLSWAPHPAARITAYAWLLNLENAAGPNASCATYGLAWSGTQPIKENLHLDYRLEGAWQTDYGDSSLDYSAPYYLLELAARYGRWTAGAAWETLGSDNGAPVRTPLATLHAWNGWADVFLNTPTAGLRDLQAFVQVTLAADTPLRVVYHKFNAEDSGADFGREIDILISKRVGRYWTFLAKYAWYDGTDRPYNFDIHKVWAQVEFNF
ncbi:alginate export family protein [Limisphaera ngatamarikiensis]|uniref:Alginate export family protein n=1 Tax=Limisphaera ngatamarikiensis TaxID=1324935 RepID=A0A6M1RK80_9BACT|nr:alginate export family protein [Limisphaera ngatamarikiensis]NGO37999.1 alginate export family protein [Limisphaera ngatamarikiensis]